MWQYHRSCSYVLHHIWGITNSVQFPYRRRRYDPSCWKRRKPIPSLLPYIHVYVKQTTKYSNGFQSRYRRPRYDLSCWKRRKTHSFSLLPNIHIPVKQSIRFGGIWNGGTCSYKIDAPMLITRNGVLSDSLAPLHNLDTNIVHGE